MGSPDYPRHLDQTELEAGLDHLRASPADDGRLEMVVRRPETNAREVLEVGQLDLAEGLMGDNWKARGSRRMPDGSAHPDMQLNIMNARCIELLAGPKSDGYWPLAGDQLFVDLNLSEANLPAGTRLGIGEAIIEITEQPHTGCKKFAQRFGVPAVKFVNSTEGKALQLRGRNAKVVQAGAIRPGDSIKKL